MDLCFRIALKDYEKYLTECFYSLLLQLIMSVLSLLYALAWILAFQVILAAKNEIITKVGKGTYNYSCEEKLEYIQIFRILITILHYHFSARCHITYWQPVQVLLTP